MLLESFRVRMYRSVRDSGPVPVFPLTALVGRRQSGKTSLLRALAGLDTRVAQPFLLDHDWPRGSRQARGEQQVACSAEFRLAEPIAGVPGLRVGRTYAGTLLVEEWNGRVESNGYQESEATGAIDEQLTAYAQAHLPRFIFSEHDSLLPSFVAGNALARPGAAEEETGVAALARLLQAAGLTANEAEHGLTPGRVRACGEHVRSTLRERGFSPGLVLDADRGRLSVALEHGGVRTLAERLPRDERFRLTVELRLAAAQLEADRKTVLLLDGPGRSFRREAHGRMRMLLDCYARADVTVIYTARLPFQIELQHSEQVLVLAPKRQGAMVDPCERGSEPKFAVRAALGMTGRTSFVVNDLNLVVEGSTDVRILHALDALLQKSGEEGLPSDLTLTSAQGAEEVAAVSTFLGRQGLGVIALFDSDSAGMTGNQHLRAAAHEHPHIERLEVLQVADAAGVDQDGAAIEGLFPHDYYMEAARTVVGRSSEALVARAAKEVDGNPGARLSRIFQAHGRRFHKGKVVELLAETLEGMSSVSELPEGMIDPVRRLMATIRAAAERLREPAAGPTKERA